MAAKHDAVINELNFKIDKLIKLYISSLEQNKSLESKIQDLQSELENLQRENKDLIMSEKRNINLTIADIPLNLNISAADEEIIRKAAKEINERVLKYKTGNTEPEPFYFLAYVSLLHTIKMLQQEQKFNEIEQINLKLDEFIKE